MGLFNRRKWILENNRQRIVATNNTLEYIIETEIKKYGNNADLNHIDVRNVTNMGSIFYKSDFNGDISKWDVSNVTDMHNMFNRSQFNGDISNWDVSNVTDMYGMFWCSKFNGDISKWNVSNVKDMRCMFGNSTFAGDISNWIPIIQKNNIDLTELGYTFTDDDLSDIKI